jgi:hypothetical protein
LSGRHIREVVTHDQRFGLFDSDQHVIAGIAFEAISGHEYVIHFDTDKAIAQKLAFDRSHAGRLEDITSGEKLAMDRPD